MVVGTDITPTIMGLITHIGGITHIIVGIMVITIITIIGITDIIQDQGEIITQIQTDIIKRTVMVT